MQCFARWIEDRSGLCFRDQTLLQFGDSWELLANYILLNPGSAVPVDRASQNSFLASLGLPFYVNGEGQYYKFSIDRLMMDLLGLYKDQYAGGAIKLYNLFNLKNPDSGKALEQYQGNRSSRFMHTHANDIQYGKAPVVIATGRNVHSDDGLENELRKYVTLASEASLYALTKACDRLFVVTKANKNGKGLVESYHPSYTFKYGNQTRIESTPSP